MAFTGITGMKGGSLVCLFLLMDFAASYLSINFVVS